MRGQKEGVSPFSLGRAVSEALKGRLHWGIKRRVREALCPRLDRLRDFLDPSPGSRLNLLDTFPLFAPNSSGTYPDRAQLTIRAINQTLPLLAAFAASQGAGELAIADIRGFGTSKEDREASLALKNRLDRFGSDKAGLGYHYLYGPILKDRDRVRGVFEIGLGTHHSDVVSNMGARGKPGASLRAFKDFLGNARIYGADVDRRILFREERIETFYVDQTDPDSFEALAAHLPSDLDLIIDDGLHAPNANIQTLKFALTKVRPGGWVVIEDIAAAAVPAWGVVAALLPDGHRAHIFGAEGALAFAVERAGDRSPREESAT